MALSRLLLGHRPRALGRHRHGHFSGVHLPWRVGYAKRMCMRMRATGYAVVQRRTCISHDHSWALRTSRFQSQYRGRPALAMRLSSLKSICHALRMLKHQQKLHVTAASERRLTSRSHCPFQSASRRPHSVQSRRDETLAKFAQLHSTIFASACARAWPSHCSVALS